MKFLDELLKMHIFNCPARRYAPRQPPHIKIEKPQSAQSTQRKMATLCALCVLRGRLSATARAPAGAQDCHPASRTKDAVRLQADAGYARTLRAAHRFDGITG